MSSVTVVSIGKVFGETGLKDTGLGIRLSLYTNIFLPSPTPMRQHKPACTSSFPHKRLFHKKEKLQPILLLRKSKLGKYLAFNVLTISNFGSCKMCQLSFPSRARLKEMRSRNLNLPSFFGAHKSLQESQYMPFDFPLEPYQNLLISLWILLHSFWGNRKTLIA